MLQQQLDPIAIHDLCAVDPHPEHQPLRVREQMLLASLDLLACIVAPLAADACGLHGLTVDDAGTQLGIASQSDTEPLAQEGVDALPGAVRTSEPEVMAHRRPGTKVTGQEPPGTTTPQEVEDAIEDRAHGPGAGTATRPGHRLPPPEGEVTVR